MIQRAMANGTSVETISRSEMSSGPSRVDIWVNGLWFTSLALGLCTAFLAVLVKQWLHQYMSATLGTYRDHSLIPPVPLRWTSEMACSDHRRSASHHLARSVGVLPHRPHHIPRSAFLPSRVYHRIHHGDRIRHVLCVKYSSHSIPYRTPFSDILNFIASTTASLTLTFLQSLSENVSQALATNSNASRPGLLSRFLRRIPFPSKFTSFRQKLATSIAAHTPSPSCLAPFTSLKDMERRSTVTSDREVVENMAFAAAVPLL